MSILILDVMKLCLCMTYSMFCLVMGFAALVPLEELREINFTKQYGIARDPEVIDILDTASRTKGVFMMFLIVLLSSAVTTIWTTWCNKHKHGKFVCFCWCFESGKSSGKGLLGRSKRKVMQCRGRSSSGLFGCWKQGTRSH